MGKKTANETLRPRGLESIQYVEIANLEPLEQTQLEPAISFERIAEMTLPVQNDDLPHRHRFHEIIFVVDGHGRHAIDGQSADLSPRMVTLIAKGQVHDFEYAEKLSVYLIRFTDDFLPAELVSPVWDYRAELFNHLGLNTTLLLEDHDAAYLRTCMDLLEVEWGIGAAFQRYTALRHLLALVILRIGRIHQGLICTSPTAQEAFGVYQAFAGILEQHFRDRHDVQYYADALQLAPVKLSRMLQVILGKTTKQIIDERIILEARRQLQYTQQSISEIAFDLGYSDQFHFSKTFKRMVTLAPQEYRAQYQKMT